MNNLETIAKLVHDELLSQLNKKCKYITNLKDLKLFVDNFPNKTGWYGWVKVYLPVTPDQEKFMYKMIDCNVKEFTDDQSRKLLYENILNFLNQDYGCSFDYVGGVLSPEVSEEV